MMIMADKWRRIMVAQLAFAFAVACIASSAHAEQLPGERHVLILHPFTPTDPAHMEFNEGLIATLGGHPDVSFSYSHEYFDYARNSNEPDFFEHMADYLRVKYRVHRPDYIVTEFNMVPLLSRLEDLFGGIPVIVNWKGPLPSESEIPANFVIIPQLPDTGQNIDLILRTRPGTKRIYLVLGDSADERRIAERLALIERDYKSRVAFVWLNRLPYPDMLEAVRNADKDAAILYYHWFADVDGNRYEPAEVFREIAGATNAPIYGNAKQFLGGGMIGGYMRDFGASGRVAATAILDLLDGKKPGEVRYVDENAYMFDWRQMKAWGIGEDRLPEGSRIEFRAVGLWEQYGVYIVSGLVFMALQTLLIVLLLINRSLRKKAERELIEANKMKDEFLINTSHELQTPLNGIINISESLLDGRCGPMSPKQEDELSVILAVSRKLSSLIRDIIDMEKIKRNELRFRLAPTDVRSASSIVLDVIRHLNDNTRVELVTDIPADLPPVVADENRLMQVLFNLLGNAVKFTERGRVTLSARAEGAVVAVSVEDTGIGMMPEEQTKMFRAFSQGSARITEQYGGSGLGLFISKQLVERMNGSLWLDWSEPGKGTRFSFMLPISDEPVARQGAAEIALLQDEAAAAAASAEPRPASGFRLLAVDDDATNLRVLKLLLEGEGHEVLTASGGHEAIRLLRERSDIDLVLLDVMMPRMSGYEACRIIRQEYSLYDLPVLLLTVRNSPEDLAAGFEAGANDFLVKPVVAKELRARVATLLEMRKSAQEALKSEMAFLRAQIKPHFLYNTLNTIAYFCEQDGQKAKDLLDQFSEYLRNSFDFKNLEAWTSLRKELEFVQAYLEIEKARFGERLQTVIRVDEDALDVRIPPLVLQPLVENAVLHGIMKRIEGGCVEIIVKLSGKEAEFTVRDNGVGMPPERVDALLADQGGAKLSRSVGVRNIHMRLKKLYGAGIRLISEAGQGTMVSFAVPLESGSRG
jgi:sensor histidine kinase YesM